MTEGTITPSLAVGVIGDTPSRPTPDDGFGVQDRLVIGQVLRSWLDARCLTPTELLYDPQALAGLLAEPGTMAAALRELPPGSGQPGGIEAGPAMFDHLRVRAAAAGTALDGLAQAGPPLDVLRQRGGEPGQSAEQDHLLRAAICRELVGCRSWLEKLALLVGLVRADAGGTTGDGMPGGGLAGLVDGLVADLLGAGTVLTELFGAHPYLGVNLRRSLDLALTVLARPADGAGTPLLFDLNELLVAGRLPCARAALLDRVRGQLGSPLPLGSGRREEDIRLFHELLGILATPAGVIGEGAMAEALVVRYARRLDQDGGAIVQPAIQGVVETLPNLFSRLYFLAALACSPLGRRSIDEVMVLVDAAAHNQTLIESAVFRPFDPVALHGALAQAAAAFDRAGLPDTVAARLRGRITGLVDAFVARGSFLDLMDAHEPSVPRRNQGLAAVITAGLVTEFGGKPLIEQHIDRIAERAAAGGGSVSVLRTPGWPQLVGREAGVPLISRFGRYRCPYCFEAKRGGVLCLVCGYDEIEGARPGVHLSAGTLLQGRYVIGRLIGQGGFGATYLGWDERLQVKVALKEYFPVSLAGRAEGGALKPYVEAHIGTFRDGIVKFIEEARTLTRLRYVKEVVEVLDHFEANGTAYLVMELLIGRTLQRYLLEEGGSIDYRRALGLMLPIAKAVHEVHRLGLVHRDISPDNIFLLDGGEAKLLDFGAARHCIGEALGALTVILKRGYAPPEQYVSDGRQGPWTDVYALAATLYCAITGRPPPDAAARQGTELIRPSRLGIHIPPAVEEVLLGGLALGWQDRPRDMKTLLQGFSRALS